MPSSWGGSSKSLKDRRIAPFCISRLGIIRGLAGRPKAGRVDDTDRADLGMAPFWREPFLSVQCWRGDTFAWYPWIHVRATSRLPSGPRRVAGDSSRCCGAERVGRSVYFLMTGTLLARCSRVEPGWLAVTLPQPLTPVTTVALPTLTVTVMPTTVTTTATIPVENGQPI